MKKFGIEVFKAEYDLLTNRNTSCNKMQHSIGQQ